jgi:hypothetical protein
MTNACDGAGASAGVGVDGAGVGVGVGATGAGVSRVGASLRR